MQLAIWKKMSSEGRNLLWLAKFSKKTQKFIFLVYKREKMDDNTEYYELQRKKILWLELHKK